MQNKFYAKFLIMIGAALFLSACANTGGDDAPVMTDPVVEDTPPPPPPPVVEVDRLDPLSQEALDQVMGGMAGSTVNFAYDRYDVDASARNILQAQANWMKANNVNVIVEGHCDERGTREYNLALGERRADSIRSFLLSAGVTGRQIETVSYGEEQPADPGHNEAAWERNRRAVMSYR